MFHAGFFKYWCVSNQSSSSPKIIAFHRFFSFVKICSRFLLSFFRFPVPFQPSSKILSIVIFMFLPSNNLAAFLDFTLEPHQAVNSHLKWFVNRNSHAWNEPLSYHTGPDPIEHVTSHLKCLHWSGPNKLINNQFVPVDR